MNYYYNQGKIYETEAELSYDTLSPEQTKFRIDNPNASVNEILNCKKEEVAQVTLEQEKERYEKIVADNYTKLVNYNVDATLTPPVYDFAKMGAPKCMATYNWFVIRGEERNDKIRAIRNCETLEELYLVNTNFSETEKPYSAEELTDEILNSRGE